MPPMLLAGILKNNTSFRAELDDEVLILLDIILEPLYGTDSSDVQGPWNQKDLNKYIPNVSTWKPVAAEHFYRIYCTRKNIPGFWIFLSKTEVHLLVLKRWS